MCKNSASLLFAILTVLLLAACGGNVDEAIATGIAQTQQISQLETAAAGAAQPSHTPEPLEVEEESGPVFVTTTRDVNMRGGDSTAYGVMTVVPGGQQVEVTGVNGAGTWYQISYHNATGWISADFVSGEVPADLPLASPAAPAPPQAAATHTPGGSGSGSPATDFSLTLNANDTDNKSISGTVSGNNVHRVTIRVEGLSGSNSVEVDIAFQCDTGQPELVKLTAPGADDNVICNNNWSHQVSSNSPAVVTIRLDGGSSVKWTLIANVSN